MNIVSVKTRVMNPPEDDLFEVMRGSIENLPERSVVAVTSKVVAIHQGRCVRMRSKNQRDDLAKMEADWYVSREVAPEGHMMYTIKEKTLVATAGIDGSNSDGYWVLWPEKIDEMTRKIYWWLRKEFDLKEVGVVMVDSHSVPLRRGVMGVALSHFGFNPLRDYRGQEDIFGIELKFATVSIPDVIAVGAVYEMGESSEQTPLALVTEMDEMEFSDDEKVNAGVVSVKVDKKRDVYQPMIDGLPWKKGDGGITKERLEFLKKENESE